MNRLWTAALGVLVLATSSAATKPSYDGVYGTICMSAETGDLGGMQVEFSTKTPTPQVAFLFCEGWCEPEDVQRVPALMKSERFSFTYTVRSVSKGVLTETPVVMTGRFLNGNLVIEGRGKDITLEPRTLKPVTKASCRRGSAKSQPSVYGAP